MAYKYKNLKTNKIVIKAEPIKGAKKREYQLMSWNHTAIIKSNDKKVIKKTAEVKKEPKKVSKK